MLTTIDARMQSYGLMQRSAGTTELAMTLKEKQQPVIVRAYCYGWALVEFPKKPRIRVDGTTRRIQPWEWVRLSDLQWS